MILAVWDHLRGPVQTGKTEGFLSFQDVVFGCAPA